MNSSEPMSEIGKVRPVITVLRQEARKKNTIRMVSAAPSISVMRTSLTELRMLNEASRTISSLTSGGSSRASFATMSRTPSATSMVLAPCDLTISTDRPRLPLIRATLSSSAWASATSATSPSITGLPPRRATIRRRKSSVVPARPRICTTCSRPPPDTLPTGTSWFSLRKAANT